MKCITKRILYGSRSDTFRLVVFSDVHLGNKNCDEALLQQTINDVRDDPFTYWLDLGDGCEWINRRDPRFDPQELPAWLVAHLKDLAKAQRERRVALFAPIANKCLALVEGNHERSILEHCERNVYEDVAEGLGLQGVCVGPSGFVRVQFVRDAGVEGNTWEMMLFLTHGFWGGRLMGAGALNLERLAGWVDADVILAGHDHRRRGFPLEKLVINRNDEIVTKRVYCASCGTFLSMAAYAERSGYRPTPTGALEFWIKPIEKEIRLLN